MIPSRRPGQSLADHQADMAEWLGCDVATMNAHHDALHCELADWLGLRSHAMRQAAGKALSPNEQILAGHEEAAVLYLQRYITMARKGA